jgi:tetratricopeptide (TPR) repeat protein
VLRHQIVILFIAVLILDRHSAGADPPRGWQTCSMTEGKGEGCGSGDQARPFQEFLAPGAWLNTSNSDNDLFGSEFHWDLQQEYPTFKVTWNGLGQWGTQRIREVRYSAGDSSFAALILVESSPNMFTLLMKWSGNMPKAELHEIDGIKVLVLEKNFGGNRPMVNTWAWIWKADGPVRLEIESAVSQAIQKVAPGYGGYQTGLDWQKLHCQTGVWKADAPGKIGVSGIVDAWFELGPEGLTVQRAEFRDMSVETPVAIRWPLTSGDPASVELTPPQTLVKQLVVEIRDFGGHPVAGQEIRSKAAIGDVRTDSQGTATLRLTSEMPQGQPVLLELSAPRNDLVVIFPCRAVVPVSQSNRPVIVARRGDRGLLTDAVALESLADCILRTAPPQEKYQAADYARVRRRAIESVARSVNLPPASLDRAIRAWSPGDAFQRGLVALFDQHPVEAAAQFKQALDSLEPAQREKLARAQFYLARALYAQRHFAESVAAHQRAAAIWPDDSALLTSWGFSLWELYDFIGAEFRLRRALSVEEGLYGADAESVGSLAKYLAGALYTKPDYAAIEKLTTRALAIAEHTSGKDSAEYADALYNVALLTDARSDYPTARAQYQRALEIRQRKLGSEHLETAQTLIQLGVLYYHQHACGAAVPLLQKALAIREHALGDAHPDTAESINAIGLCHEETGNLEMAERYYRRALAISENVVGENNIVTANYLSNLGNVLTARKRGNEAEPLQRRAMEIQEQMLGPDHPDLLDTISKLALLLNTDGQFPEAERLLYRILASRERISGLDHPDVASALGDLAAVLLNDSKNSEAEPLLRRALAIQEKSVGPGVDTAKSLNDLAILLDRQGKLAESVATFERALAMYKDALGPQSPERRGVEERLREVQKKVQK